MIGQIANKYGGSDYADVISGIELLNEPKMSVLPGGRGLTQDYYQKGFNIVHGAGPTPVVIHDGFAAPSSWNGFLTGSGTSGAIVDHHEYQAFTNSFVALTPEAHIGEVYSNAATWAPGADKFVVCGEWSAAMTDCAPAINGWGIGARYDGTYSTKNPDGSYSSSSFVGSCGQINFIDQWSDYNKTTTKNFIKAQLDVYEHQVQGHFFWNFKTEATAEWDLFRLIDNGVWPGFG